MIVIAIIRLKRLRSSSSRPEILPRGSAASGAHRQEQKLHVVDDDMTMTPARMPG
jgi:hypothetical protein